MLELSLGRGIGMSGKVTPRVTIVCKLVKLNDAKLVGYRCNYIEGEDHSLESGKFVDISVDVVKKLKIVVPDNLPVEYLVEHNGKLMTSFEAADPSFEVPDCSTNNKVLGHLVYRYGRSKHSKPNLELDNSITYTGIGNKLVKEDVFGVIDHVTRERKTNGMVIASSGQKCPVFKDILPPKAVTVVFQKELESDVIEILTYVHGGDCVTKRKEIGNKVALRSEYRCW